LLSVTDKMYFTAAETLKLLHQNLAMTNQNKAIL